MLRKIILILFFTSSISNAADVSNFFSNLIPGNPASDNKFKNIFSSFG